jgi:signal transduction histidine kinase
VSCFARERFVGRVSVAERVPAEVPVVDRMNDLVQAVVGIGSQVGVDNVGRWIVTTAAKVAAAQYAALGVLDPAGESRLSRLFTVGIDAKAGSVLEVPVLIHGEVYGNLHLTGKRGGGEFTKVDEQLVLALATAAGLAMQNAQLYEQARQRQQWLEASRDITTMLLGGSPLGEVFPRLIACVRELAGADTAFLALPVGDGTVRAEVADGFGANEIRGMILPVQSMSAQVMGDHPPVAVADARHDRRIWQRVIEAAGAGPALFVPLGTAEAMVGTLVVTNQLDGPSFSAETISLIESIAAQTAIALRLGALAKVREEVAVLGDRDRIARDLHDLVIQRLFATGMSLEGTLRLMQPTPALDRVRRAVDDLDGTIREIRSTIFALQSPAPFAGGGLQTAIRHAIQSASSTLGFDPHLRLDGPVDLMVPQPVGEQMLAVLREGLSNAAHHAQATALVVTITVTVTDVCLAIQDNGIGLPADGRRSGLANLARRATDLGGRFEAHATTDPSGTLVQWCVPLSAA